MSLCAAVNSLLSMYCSVQQSVYIHTNISRDMTVGEIAQANLWRPRIC